MQKIPKLRAIYPGIEHDQLFVATYPHPGNANTCRECFGETIARRHLEQEIPLPSVHFGRIAFSSMLMRSAEHLDADTGEAEKLFWRLLRVQTKVLGEEHPDTSGTMEKLAWMHLDQGRLDHSEALYQKVLHTRRRTMGVHHPDTAFILNRLGVVYARKEMWEDAEKFYAGHWIPREPCWERGTPTRWRAWNTWRGYVSSKGGCMTQRSCSRAH